MRLRFGVLAAFIICGLLSLYLGFANLSIPNDKFVHFCVFFVMSGLFFWVTEFNSLTAIRTFTFVICTLLGGIGSEFAQGYLAEYRTFDPFDIVANVCGSLSAIIVSHFYYKYLQKKKRTSGSGSGNIVRGSDLERQVRLLDELDADDEPAEGDSGAVDGISGESSHPKVISTTDIELTKVQPAPLDPFDDRGFGKV